MSVTSLLLHRIYQEDESECPAGVSADGEAATQVSARGPVSKRDAEPTRMRQEIAKLCMEKEMPKRPAA